MKKPLYFSLFLLFLTPAYYAQADSIFRKHLMELSAQYPVGMSRDSSEERSCKIQRWILVQDKKTCATVYEQKTYSYGAVFWFKNGTSISRDMFLEETTK